AIVLTGDLLARREDGLRLAELHDDVALLEAADDAGAELALPVLELVVGHLPLGIADLLDDDLLGGLRRDAAERRLVELELDADRVAGGAVGIELAGFLETDLRLVLGLAFDGRAELEDLDLAGLVAELRFDVAFEAVLL